jgi:hypothetical protein
MKEEYIKILQASDELSMTTQALYEAIKKGLLPYKVIDGVRHISRVDLDKYLKSRYKRKVLPPGELSVKMAAHIACITQNAIYQHLRAGSLPFIKRGGTVVIKEADLKELLKRLNKR